MTYKDGYISFNLSGRIFQVSSETYLKIRRTLPEDIIREICLSDDEVYFERHPEVFQSVLSYHNTGHLHLPPGVCHHLFENEIKFWGVDPAALDRFCYREKTVSQDNMNTLDRFDKYMYGQQAAFQLPRAYIDGWRLKIWLTLTDPVSSKIATVYLWVSMLVVILSITSVTVSTFPLTENGDKETCSLWNNYMFLNYVQSENETKLKSYTYQNTHVSELFKVEIFCTVFFTAEIILKVSTCPKYKTFFFSLLNMIDFLSVLPLYMWVIITGNRTLPFALNIPWTETLLELISLLRVCRVFRLARTFRGIRITLFTISNSIYDMFLLIILLLMSTVFFASMLYLLDKLPSILHGFWLCIITMTTVGYGDSYSMTPIGKIIGSMCAITGLFAVAITVPIFTDRFLLLYSYADKQRNMPSY